MGKKHVLITGCCSAGLWYKDNIGSIYEVEPMELFGLYKLIKQELFIYEKDCIASLPSVENDCDIVFEIKKVGFFALRKAYFNKTKHHLITSHEKGQQGWIEIVCWKSKNKYRHIIQCPNTNYCVCRGCGKKI